MNNGTAPNANRLLWAGFFSIFASGVGFSVRAGILGDWAKYGFTLTELGEISGGGLTGFGVIIILGAFIADRIGYGRLMVLAFLMHLVSAGMTLATDQVYNWFGGGDAGRNAVYWNLFISMFLFAIANGTCEVVVNPMVATLYPHQKTHYLNILHAGWPGGLIAGGLASYLMNEGTIGTWEPLGKVHWMVQMSLFLVPTLIYGSLMLGQRFPTSEASQAGVSFKDMLLEFASPVLLLLLLIHAMVGYVELGTDSWIAKITGSIMEDPKKGLLLFVYTSGLMFALRFFAGPIEKQLSPLGLLCISGVFGAVGLTLLSAAETIVVCVLAATVYAIGKTFLWPTMLAVTSEQFPRGGAITIGAVGGMGMLSAGLLGNPGIGYKQDYNATKELRKEHDDTYERYAVKEPSHFLFAFSVKGLDGSKVGVLELEKDRRKALEDMAEASKEGDEKKRDKAAKTAEAKEKELKLTLERDKDLKKWWEEDPEAQKFFKEDNKPIEEARLYGGRVALQLTAFVPAMMAILYLSLILYFRSKGGYKPVKLHEEPMGGGISDA